MGREVVWTLYCSLYNYGIVSYLILFMANKPQVCVYADIILTTTPTHPLKMRSDSAWYDILIPEPGLHYYNCYTLLIYMSSDVILMMVQ